MASTGNGNGKPTDTDGATQSRAAARAGEGRRRSTSRICRSRTRTSSKLLKEPGDQPNLQLSINVNAKSVGPDALRERHRLQRAGDQPARHDLPARARLRRPVQDREHSRRRRSSRSCSSTARRSCSRSCAASSPTSTREGGFPPLLLDPFDFASLYCAASRSCAPRPRPKPRTKSCRRRSARQERG